MTQYIERALANDALIDSGIEGNDLEKAVNAICSVPAADVRPVVRGKWIDHQIGNWVYAKCSECGTVHDVKSHFCPTCGAGMRKEDENV